MGSSGRSNSSSVDEDVYNEAVSETELEIDENLDTIAEAGADKAAADGPEEAAAEEHELESCSPPSKRKSSFFNPTHTSSCPSKSPSPTLIQSTQSLSPIDAYQTNATSEKLVGAKAIKSEPDQMKSQYPLLYNQLCKQQNTNSANNDMLVSPEVQAKQNLLPSLEQQNQILLNRILSQSGGITENPLIKSLLTELLNRSTMTTVAEPVHHTNEILTKILTSSVPGSGGGQTANTLSERLGALLKPVQTQQTKPSKTSANNNNNQAKQQQHSHKSVQSKANYQQTASTPPVPTTKNNTVNSLLQSYNSMSQELASKPKSVNSSRKRHLNQQQQQQQASETTTHDLSSLLTSNPDLLAYANKQQLQHGMNKNGGDINEMVAMMLAAQQQTNFNRQTSLANHQQQQQQQQQQRNQSFNNNQTSAKNSSNLAKNQTYNQLLLLHQTQKLQQRQQQHEAALLSQRQSLQQAYMNSDDLSTAHSSLDMQGIDPHSLQQFYQQQQQLVAAVVANGQNSQGSNGANGDNNMPLKLRFKMLQLKTGEVN